MKLPNADRAVVDIAKLQDYCLSPHHPRGRHKASVFSEALGITQSDAEILKGALIKAAKNSEATLAEKDKYGQRYVVDFEMRGIQGNAVQVRSSWIILVGENFARLTSCCVI